MLSGVTKKPRWRELSVDMTHTWGDDDASEYAGLPVESPHDEAACLACATYAEVGAPSSGRTSSGSRWWSSGNREVFEFAQEYPIRFKAIMEHRRQVARARRSA